MNHRKAATHPSVRILMVDDDPCLCEPHAEVLRQHGYEVDLASDGEAGWKMLQADQNNRLITENDLPGMTGVGLVKKLRLACMPLPVLMVIGTLPAWRSAEYPWLLKATKLPKPHTFEDMVGLVKNVFTATGRSRTEIAPPANAAGQTPSVCLRW